MKKGRNILWIAALSLGAVLAGCSALPEDVTAPERQEIRFTGSVGTFQVKATDTAFEAGDAVGLFTDSKIGAKNLLLEWNGQRFIPEHAIYWGLDEMDYDFAAYYPYSSDVESGMVDFYVKADQTTHELFTASDLMLANARYGKTNDAVALEFHHALSKLVIRVNCELEEEIADVYLGNVFGGVKVDIYARDWANIIGETGTIKAGKVALADGTIGWAAIVPPQVCQPVIMVTTASGKQFSCEAESGDIIFRAGCRYNANVVIDANTESTEFTSDVTEWEDNKDTMFTVTTWSIIGSMTDWSRDLPMGYLGDGIYEIYYGFGGITQYKFRMNGNWDVNFGIGEPGSVSVVSEGVYNLVPDGGNINMAQDGLWHILLDTNSQTVEFTLEIEGGGNVLWQGDMTIDSWQGLEDLSWGKYDWSTVSPGTILYVDIMPLVDASWWGVRIANGKWMALPGLPDLFENPGNTIEIKLTESMVEDLVENGGLVITGEGFRLLRVALSE